MIKKGTLLFFISCCLILTTTYSQNISSLNIDSCYALAKRNFPLVKQYALIDKSKEYSIENANKGYLPQFNIAGQATYQSEVTKLPISIPNVAIPELSKDQYKLYGEVAQPLTDLFTVKDQRALVKANSEIEQQKIEVELYKLKERINSLFFGMLLLDAQLEQTALLKKDIQSGIDKTTTAIANGTALKSSADNLKAELLKTDQRAIELKSNRKGYASMLSLFINQPVTENTILVKPNPKTVDSNLNRPELKLYELQKKTYDVQNKLINDKNLPRFSLFVQGGLGRPALNLLNNDLKGFYIGGLRISWNLTGFYTSKNEKQLLTLNQQGLDIQKDVFAFNTNLNLKQQDAEIAKVVELIETDKSIIALRESIKNTTKNQLEFGTATTNDYLTALNAQDQAQQNMLLHQIQLTLAQYNYQTTSGN